MSVTDKKIHSGAKVALTPVRLHYFTTATGQTAKQTDALTIPYAFEIVQAEFYCLTRPNAGFAADLTIGSTSALASTVSDPTADTVVAATLSTTLASRRGAKGAQLCAKYTTDADGAATNGSWTVWIRPLGLNGDAQ